VTQVLAGLTVVVTRPAHQSAALTARLEALGAQVIAFPAIRIEPLPLDAAPLPAPDDFDWVIYVSANAVAHATAALPRPARARVAALGPATARALARAGIRVDALPRTGADSEGLLALPGFAAPQGLRVLILRGAGGRGWLRAELERRGAAVKVLELYRRVPAEPAPGAVNALARVLGARAAPAIVVTSVEVLAAFVRIVPAALGTSLRAAPLVVPGARVAAAARESGWHGALIEAASAEDAALVAALAAHVAGGGAAKDA
jgi:uroporphyrinogen-III synthase